MLAICLLNNFAQTERIFIILSFSQSLRSKNSFWHSKICDPWSSRYPLILGVLFNNFVFMPFKGQSDPQKPILAGFRYRGTPKIRGTSLIIGQKLFYAKNNS